MKDAICVITCALTVCLMYYGIGFLIYKFTSLEFIQSEPCQAFLMILSLILFAVGIKIFRIIKR